MKSIIHMKNALLVGMLMLSACATTSTSTEINVTEKADVTAKKIPSAGLKFVEKNQLGDGIRLVCAQLIMRTQTGGMLIKNLGGEAAGEISIGAMNRHVPKYQEEWNYNLALTYEEFFTEKELISLTDEQQDSPYASKLIESMPAIDKSMQEKSTPIIKKLTADVLTDMLSTAAAQAK